MALTDVQQVRLYIGLRGAAEDLLHDEEIQHFLDANKNNVKKACIDAAGALLFQLSAYLHERSGTELEIWGHTWFENYKIALQQFLRNPNNNTMFDNIVPFGGGISVQDARSNLNNMDNIVVEVDNGIPKDGEAMTSTNTSHDVFKRESARYDVNSTFGL